MSSRFQTKIINEYKSNGYIVLNVIKLSENGYPDLIALKDGKAIFIECKEYNDSLKPLQEHRIDELINQGFKAFCIQDKKGIIYGNND
jgi:Holliday junction resolvase